MVESDGHVRDNLHARGGHGVGARGVDGAELADKALAPGKLLSGGTDIGFVRAAHQFNLIATFDGVEHSLSGVGRATDHVMEHPMLHSNLLPLGDGVEMVDILSL